MRYHLLDEGAFAEADLAGRDALAALLFRLENATQPEQIVAVVDAVIDWFRRHPGFDTLKPLFAGLAGRAVEAAQGRGFAIQVSDDLQEVRSMLANRAAEWKRQWTDEGKLEGRQEGKQQGAAALLIGLLERRFGPVPDIVRGRVAAADMSVIQAWSLRVLDAGSLDDVLD